MAKQERRLFDGDAQVWVQSYKNLHNVAHWHFENELAVCQRGSAEVMLDGEPLKQFLYNAGLDGLSDSLKGTLGGILENMGTNPAPEGKE